MLLLVVDLLGRGLGPLLASPEFYGWLGLALAGTVFGQSSFRAGALTASLPTMMLVELAQAAVLSVALLGETLRPGRATGHHFERMFRSIGVMTTRAKISATLTPERLREAQQITGTANISQLLDEALAALIERELEKRWLEANPDDELPGEVEVDLSSVPWQE
ncbi:MAG TPA: DMT family transporter [Mycobacterium sp.]|nr:DMT family transporter [Mycobacterium sp.]